MASPALAAGDPTRRRIHTPQASLRILTAILLAVLTLPLLSTSASASVLDDIDGVAPVGTATQADATGHDDDVFQHASEDSATTEWGIKEPGYASDGADIHQVYSRHEIAGNGDIWFYLGFTRTEPGVTAQVVELNQLPNLNRMPARSDGDVRITFTQPSGGSPLAQLAVNTWTDSHWGGATIIDDASVFRGRTGADGLFAELAINLTATDLQPACGSGFTAVNIRSRASDKEPAALKDYVAPLAVDIEARCKNIRVEKYDATTGAALTGASFRLYQDDGDGVHDLGDDQVGDTADTAVGGSVAADQGADANAYTWENLVWGLYFVEETRIPAGYRPDRDLDTHGVKAVSLSAATPGGVAVVPFRNPQATAQLRVEKYAATAGAPALSGAGFTLYRDDGDSVLEPDTDQRVLDPRAGSDGEAAADEGPGQNAFTWTGLAYGEYFVVESRVPAGYDDDPGSTDGVRSATLTAADAGETVVVSFHNPPQVPRVGVAKFDGTTGAPLSGASFQLYRDGNDSGTFDGAALDPPVGPPHAADQGVAPATNTYTWESGLAVGPTYFVEETVVPSGYDRDPAAGVPYTGDHADQAAAMKAVTVNPGGGLLETVRFDNPRSTARLRVEKFDGADRDLGLSGARFQLYRDEDGDGVLDPEDDPIGGEVTADGQGSTPANGYTWPQDLPWGAYLVRETHAPAGYLAPTPATELTAVEVTPADAGTTVRVPVYNDKDAVGQDGSGTIVVTKLDADRPTVRVDGATFQLFEDRNGNGAVDAADAGPTAPVRTGVGSYRWSDLPSGSYLVVEAAPPAGYLAPAHPVQAVALGHDEVRSVEFFNAPERTAIQVTKRDARTGAPLDTATFQLWEDADADGRFDADADREVGDRKSTEQGVVGWVGLRTGTYFVQETEAPRGYELPANTVLTIVVDGSNAGGTLTRSFYDPQLRTTLAVEKQDDATREVLAGATFQVHLDVDADGTLDEGDLPVGAPRVTDARGLASWDGLEFGRYLVEEVAPPPGYGLAETTTLPVVLDRDNAGGTLRLVFADPALGEVSVVKAALERDAAGAWVPSDGVVRLGDQVQYVITVRADGARIHHDVVVVDHVPGYDPADRTSTAHARYVDGSAGCDGPGCTVSFDAGGQRLTWSLGDLRGELRTLRFVVRMPLRPENPTFDRDGVMVETLVNVADLSWREQAAGSGASPGADVARSVRSNAVVTTVTEPPEVLDTPPGERPTPAEKPRPGLPETGAPAHSGLATSGGALAVLLGGWLMLVGRGRGHLPRR